MADQIQEEQEPQNVMADEAKEQQEAYEGDVGIAMCSIPQRGAKRNRTHSEAARWQGTAKIKPPLRVAYFWWT